MFRRLAQLIVGLAVVVAGIDLATTFPDGTPGALADLGTWWAALHQDSLQLLQPALERHVSPVLWDPVVLTLLLWPLAAILFALGALFWLLRRRRETNGRSRRTGSRDIG